MLYHAGLIIHCLESRLIKNFGIEFGRYYCRHIKQSTLYDIAHTYSILHIRLAKIFHLYIYCHPCNIIIVTINYLSMFDNMSKEQLCKNQNKSRVKNIQLCMKLRNCTIYRKLAFLFQFA